MKTEDNISKVMELGQKLGYLPYMIQRYLTLLGLQEAYSLLHFNETYLEKTIRINTINDSQEIILASLKKKGFILSNIPSIPEGYTVINSPVALSSTPEFLNGSYFIQGKNSMYPSRLLDASQNDLVGDFAAAPGGKTSHLAQLMKNKGKIIAVEISANRCRSLKANLSRMGIKNTIILNMDARNILTTSLKFDKILLDAPCSGSGIIVSDKSRKNSINEVELNRFYTKQVELLETAIKSLNVGGNIVYCTCSLEPEENEAVISKILEHYDLSLLPLDIEGDPGLLDFQGKFFNSQLVNAKRLYPHKTKGEGFFITKMVKNSE